MGGNRRDRCRRVGRSRDTIRGIHGVASYRTKRRPGRSVRSDHPALVGVDAPVDVVEQVVVTAADGDAGQVEDAFRLCHGSMKPWAGIGGTAAAGSAGHATLYGVFTGSRLIARSAGRVVQ